MSLGPVQLLVVAFDRPDFSGEVLQELERLRESDVVRVIDLLVVHKSAQGVVRRLHHSDLTAGEAEGGRSARATRSAPRGASRSPTRGSIRLTSPPPASSTPRTGADGQ